MQRTTKHYSLLERTSISVTNSFTHNALLLIAFTSVLHWQARSHLLSNNLICTHCRQKFFVVMLSLLLIWMFFLLLFFLLKHFYALNTNTIHTHVHFIICFFSFVVFFLLLHFYLSCINSISILLYCMRFIRMCMHARCRSHSRCICCVVFSFQFKRTR